METKRIRVSEARSAVGIDATQEKAAIVRRDAERHRLRSALSRQDRVNIIAEIKRASPSKGVINDAIDVRDLAKSYQAGGAAAISVLTEQDFFKGSLEDLVAVRDAVSLPILRKDFVVDEYQIYESAAAGADAILLIVAALNADHISRYLRIARDELGMDAIVEVHDLDELAIAIAAGADIIGVNNRNLSTFDVSLDVSRHMIKSKPKNALMIAESGISTANEISELKGLGYDGFLIGESLMRSGNDAGLELLTLIGRNVKASAADLAIEHTERKKVKVKICGITNIDDARHAARSGADELGFNFYEKSPRYIDPKVAAELIRQLPENVVKVGLFVNSPAKQVAEIAASVGLDVIQLHGDEEAAYLTELAELTDRSIMKAIRFRPEMEPAEWAELDVHAILLDSYSEGYGGSGKTIDWHLLRRSVERFPATIYLAGGLDPDNVAEAIRIVKPYAVDVASGVESAPGRKDPEKVAAFIKAAKEAI